MALGAGDGRRACLQNPIPAIFDAARFLDAAVSAHLVRQHSLADELIRAADMPVIRDWSESLWGKGGPWTRPVRIENSAPFLPKDQRQIARNPTVADTAALLRRDGFHCRFCGIPIVRAEMRSAMRRSYPEALRWGPANVDQHTGFQAMWLQYDHVLPHARGGTNSFDNLIVTCAPCNNGRSNLTLDEVGLSDPRERPPFRSMWDGLERFAGDPRGV
ncbi:hypothetical protein BH10PSE9_BH10PSE9_11210 [soil metagenome]